MELISPAGQVKCENQCASVLHWASQNWTSGPINNIRWTDIKLMERLAGFIFYFLTQQDGGDKEAVNAVNRVICPGCFQMQPCYQAAKITPIKTSPPSLSAREAQS